MSQEPVPTEAVAEVAATGKAPEIQRNGYKLKYGVFDGETLKGFGFYYPEFESVGAAIDQYTESSVLNLINSKVAFAIRTKAQNAMKRNESDNETVDEYKERLAELLEQGQVCILTIEDAEAWKPGEREVSSESGLMKRIKQAMDEAKEAAKAGKTELKLAKIAEAKDYKRQLDELTAMKLDAI
jgi:hypothetical protein